LENINNLSPNNEEIILALSNALLMSGNTRGAIEILEDFLPLAEDKAEIYYSLGNFYRAESNTEKAMEGNKSGGNIKGGSTISNQTAKNVFLWPGRNYLRKGLEAYFTLLIEICWSKERIIEVYLNVIETGDGIYGVEAAAQTFYNKSAETLNRGEAAMIAAVLPNPLRWSPANPTAYNYKRQSWILRNMGNLAPVGFGK
jgi:monofunctional biosynthetic peptidoglycan transglycosylase